MKTTATQYAMTYTINNGESFSKPIYYWTFKSAIDDGRKIVRGKHFPQEGNRSYVTIINSSTGKTVYEGMLWGRCKRFINLTEED